MNKINKSVAVLHESNGIDFEKEITNLNIEIAFVKKILLFFANFTAHNEATC